MDYPIMFSAPMVLRLLAEAQEQGTGKSMTRRLAWRDFAVKPGSPRAMPKNAVVVRDGTTKTPTPWQRVQIGDRLWVRENFWHFGRWSSKKIGGGKVKKTFKPFPFMGHDPKVCGLILDAGLDAETYPIIQTNRGRFGQSDPAWHLRPNIFLPRSYSRLTLTITGKKIERLQDISEQDCEREGVQRFGDRDYGIDERPNGIRGTSYVACFSALWWSLHGIGAWNENPEVVALTFRVELRNIDTPEPVENLAREIEQFLVTTEFRGSSRRPRPHRNC